MKRTLLALVLCCLASLGQASVATTTINCKIGGDAFLTKHTQCATNATENVVVIQVTPGHPVLVEFVDTADWHHRSTTADSTTDQAVTAGSSYKLWFGQTTTFYTVRSTADGVLTITPLLVGTTP